MKFHSKPIEENEEVPLADDGQWEQQVDRWEERALQRPARSDESDSTPCFVLSVHPPDGAGTVEARLAELLGLIEAQGDHVVGSHAHALSKPDPRTLIRSGVAERVAEEAKAAGAAMLVVGAQLTPSQTRNLEDATGLPICDREAVILNVFRRNARTRRARIQVEIAHLEYLRPRIRGIGLNMDQQMGGGKYGRGAGETASELLARQLDGRLAELRRGLAQLERSDATQRKHRSGCARVVLVGYTNAGKTSLMNALTQADLSARDRPFETLETTSRALSRHGQDVLLSDTVGFIRDLPERLFASFESTLTEVSDATLLLLVVDASDPELGAHLETTSTVLERLGAAEIPRLVVFNKCDRLDGESLHGLERFASGHPHQAVSSHDPASVVELREAILDEVRSRHLTKELFVPYDQQAIVGELYAECRVLRSTSTETGTQILVEGEGNVVERLARKLRRKQR